MVQLMRELPDDANREARRRPLLRYGFAVVTVIGFAFAQYLLADFLPPSPQLFAYPAILLVARFAGRGPGLLAIATACPILAYWFLPPYDSIAIGRADDALDLLLFACMSVLLVELIERLARAEESARVALEAAPVPTALLDRDLRLVYANPSFLRAVQRERREVMRIPMTDLLTECEGLRQMSDFSTVELRGRLLRSRGEALDVEGTLSRVRRTGGAAYVAQLLDVSERILRDKERARREELRAEWNAIVAHDLRQPLQAISLRADRLRRGSRTAEADLAAIARATKRLDAMVEDLLDGARLEARQMNLRPELVDVASFVASRVDAARLEGASRAFEVLTPSPVPAFVDPDRLAQILENLLSNAVKYGDEAAPIRVEVKGEGDTALLSVGNSGRGIGKDELPHLFDRFFRTESARGSRTKGVGLGLYIVKELVVAQGGEITCESEPGRWTTFHIRLPAQAPRGTPPS